ARRRERQGSIAEKAREHVEEVAHAPPPSSQATERPARPAERPPQPTTPPTAEHDGGQPPGPSVPSATPGDGGEVPRDRLLIRRVVGLLAVAAVVVLLYFVGKEVKDLFGDDPQPIAEPKPAKVSELLVPEGLDRRQIADLAEEEGLKGDYAEASKRAKGFDPAEYGADRGSGLEGFLFPATYELPRKATANDLVGRQLEAFEDNVAEVDLSYAKSKNLNVYDVLKIASMVEREIQVPEERRMAAAVIYNRLAAGDTLGIDATIRYEDGNYNEPLTESRLAEDTPYNTRINAGLPPTPIGNPGLASIEAAAKPARSDAYYFVVKPGTCGEHVFVKTEQQFARAESEYQEALEAEGGSPTEC
ncbi:MAG: endolytic transglycosylase MltG, partial [Solirubrobacterales bacterium]